MIVVDAAIGDDAALVEGMAGGDPEGVSALYDRYGALAFSLAYRLLRERGAAEDVVQAAFLNVWRSAATYDAKRGAVRPWLLTIVHHQAINVLRTQRSRGGSPVDIDGIAPLVGDHDTAATVERSLAGERVRGALATLPPDQRQIILLAYFGGLSHSEIAARTTLPLGTVKGRMRAALARLRVVLYPEEGITD